MANVLVVTTSYPAHDRDPSGHFVRTEARARIAAGDAVTVVAPAPAGCPPGRRPARPGEPDVWLLAAGDAFGWPGALARLRERPARLAIATTFVADAVRFVGARRDVDRVVAHWLVPSGIPIALASPAPLEVVVHGSDVALVERLPGVARRALLARLVRRGARLRVVSEELRARLLAAGPPGFEPLCTVEPCAIDLGAAPSRAEARALLDVRGAERLAVVVGRLVPGKRPDVAIRMATSAGADRIVLVGDGPLAPALAARFPHVQQRGLVPRDRALAWIAAADLLVSASRDEGAPSAIREARALGTPVLAAPAGDLAIWARRDAGITLVDA